MSQSRTIPLLQWCQSQGAKPQHLHLESLSLFPQQLFTDTREAPAEGVYLPLRGEHFDGHAFLTQALQAGALWAFCEKAYYQAHAEELAALPLMLVEDTLVALQTLARSWRRELGVPVIAITGSSGKTSTKEILKQVFARDFHVHATPANWNNEVGVPKTLLGLTENHSLCLVEMGMRGAGQIRELCDIAEPDWGVITNVGPVHIGELGSQEAVTQAKWELAVYLLERWGFQHPRLVINGDNAFLAQAYACLSAREQQAVVRVGTNPLFEVALGESQPVLDAEAKSPGETALQQVTYAHRGETPHTLYLDLLGQHQALNLLSGLMLLRLLQNADLPDQMVLRIPRLSGRQETHELPHAGLLINDAYNANPDSMRAALQALTQLPGPHLAVLGMMGELGEKAPAYHQELGAYCATLPLKKVVVVGTGAQAILAGLSPEQGLFCEDAAQAVASLRDLYARWPGSRILVKASRSAHLEDVVQGFLAREV